MLWEHFLKNKTKTTMKTEKLTVKDAMLYPNATLVNKNNDEYQNIISFLESKLSNFKWLKVGYLINNYKLKLRHKESLTEEEMFEIDDLDGDGKNPLDVKVRDQEYIEVDLTNVAISDYLRSINIDIDGFIASGKAVAE
jgi:hypothetical protein